MAGSEHHANVALRCSPCFSGINGFLRQIVMQDLQHWPFVAPLLHKPKNEADYDALVVVLDELTDLIGDDESHPLMGLLDIIGDWVEAYDLEHHPMPKTSGAMYCVQ